MTAKKVTVAVIGTGPAGLSVLKNLREDGFAVTAFERRPNVGGLWAYNENPSYTTALPRTRANLSKFTCGYTDYPMPDHFPTFMKPAQFQEFMEGYAKHFDLYQDIKFNTNVNLVTRDEDNAKWKVEVDRSGKLEVHEFDKIVFCHGYQTVAKFPTFEGQDKFEGKIMHAQSYRKPDEFKGKNVVVLGLHSSSGDIIPDLVPHASKVYISHRRGALPFKRFRGGVPVDLGITWRRRMISQFMQRHFPRLSRVVADAGVAWLARKTFGKLNPAWRLEPFPSLVLHLPGSWEDVMSLLQDGSIESLHGIKRFVGPRAIEFSDGRIIEDVDAVIMCTGYRADWGPLPFVETSKPTEHGYAGPPIYRMFMNLFPPKYADSCVVLNYSAFGKNNGFSFSDVTSMAISNVFRGVEPLPSKKEMERHIDQHHAWVASRWAEDPTIDVSCVRQWEFQGWQHKAAGTGMESLGWGLKGWMFWFKDRKMYNLMNNGVETAHAFRYFETGKRKTWDGARAEIIHQNERVKALFPKKDDVYRED